VTECGLKLKTGMNSMRRIKFRVIADHSINLRPDKYFKFPHDAMAYAMELYKMGYENVAVKIVPIGE